MKLHLLKTLGAFALGLATLTATASEARADTVTYKVEVNKSTDSLANVFSIIEEAMLPKFNKDLGRLQEVTIFGVLRFENDIDIEPKDSWFPIYWEATARIRLAAPHLGGIIDKTEFASAFKPFNGPGVQINVDSFVDASGAKSTTLKPALDWYTGPAGSKFFVLVRGDGTSFWRTDGGEVIVTPYNRQIGGDGSNVRSYVGVTYKYSPTPEPSTFALLGLVGAGVLVRRRRKARA